jgi:hypothetical protein
MIRVTVVIDREGIVATEVISAASIREAVSVAEARYTEAEVRVAFPIDPEPFFPTLLPREPARAR